MNTKNQRNMPGAPEKPKARPTLGFLGLLVSLTIYIFAVAAIGDLIVTWPTWVVTLYYIIAGIVWIFPAVRILRWALKASTN